MLTFVRIACVAMLSLACGRSATRGQVTGAVADAESMDASVAAPDVDAVDAGTLAPPVSATGRWMQRTIGDCIDVEEWLQFQPPHGFVHTVVDRNACQQHSVTNAPGTLDAEGAVLHMQWQEEPPFQSGKFAMERRFTAVIVDAKQVVVDAPDPGYAYGTRALNRMAYAHTSHVDYERKDDAVQGTLVQKATIRVRFDAPLQAVAQPHPCQMHVELAVVSQAESATETFTLPCTYGPDKVTGWQRIAATGFEGSQTDGSWSDYFAKQGWWQQHKAPVANLMYDKFRPVLYFQPAHPEILFHDVWHAWYTEMLSAPPTSLP